MRQFMNNYVESNEWLFLALLGIDISIAIALPLEMMGLLFNLYW